MPQPNKMDFTEVNVDVIKYVTEKAVLVEIDDTNVWVPRSVLSMTDDARLEEGMRDMYDETLNIHTWFADKEF